MMWATVAFLFLTVATAIAHSRLTRTKEREVYVPQYMGLKDKDLGAELSDISPATAAGGDTEKSETLLALDNLRPPSVGAPASKRQLPQLSAPRLFRRPIAVSAEAVKPQQPANAMPLAEAAPPLMPQARQEQLSQQQPRGGVQSASASAPVRHAFNRLRCWFNPVTC